MRMLRVGLVDEVPELQRHPVCPMPRCTARCPRNIDVAASSKTLELAATYWLATCACLKDAAVFNRVFLENIAKYGRLTLKAVRLLLRYNLLSRHLLNDAELGLPHALGSKVELLPKRRRREPPRWVVSIGRLWVGREGVVRLSPTTRVVRCDTRPRSSSLYQIVLDAFGVDFVEVPEWTALADRLAGAHDGPSTGPTSVGRPQHLASKRLLSGMRCLLRTPPAISARRTPQWRSIPTPTSEQRSMSCWMNCPGHGTDHDPVEVLGEGGRGAGPRRRLPPTWYC